MGSMVPQMTPLPSTLHIRALVTHDWRTLELVPSSNFLVLSEYTAQRG